MFTSIDEPIDMLLVSRAEENACTYNCVARYVSALCGDLVCSYHSLRFQSCEWQIEGSRGAMSFKRD